jgi:hypothetical protein
MPDNRCLGLTECETFYGGQVVIMNRTRVQIFGAAGLLLLAASVAQADTITAISSLVGNDSGSWSNLLPAPSALFPAPGSAVPNGSTAASAADIVTVSFAQGATYPGAVYLAGTSWNGPPNGFPAGTVVLGSHFNGNILPGSDALTLTFTTPVSAFGLYVQDVAYDVTYTATISATFTGGCTGTCTFSNSVPSDGTGDAEFIGLSDATGFNISSVTIDVPTTGAFGAPQYFGVGPFTLTDPLGPGPRNGVPEPASLMLMASGLAAVAWKLRRRSRG